MAIFSGEPGSAVPL